MKCSLDRGKGDGVSVGVLFSDRLFYSLFLTSLRR